MLSILSFENFTKLIFFYKIIVSNREFYAHKPNKTNSLQSMWNQVLNLKIRLGWGVGVLQINEYKELDTDPPQAGKAFKIFFYKKYN